MFDLEKAIFCVEKMKEYFEIKQQDADVNVPSCLLPGTNEYIVYLFYSCLLDYGVRSKIYHSNLIHTYKKYQHIFNPSFVVNHYLYNSQELLKLIKENIHPRYPNVALKKWIELSEYLNYNFPKEKLKEYIMSLKSYQELYSFIISIHGYGQKTGGLLVRLICESRICSFTSDVENIPIDRHDIEISYFTGVLKKKKITGKEIEQLSHLWVDAASKNNISASDVDKYLWSIGNRLCTNKMCCQCPLNLYCKRKTN